MYNKILKDVLSFCIRRVFLRALLVENIACPSRRNLHNFRIGNVLWRNYETRTPRRTDYALSSVDAFPYGDHIDCNEPGRSHFSSESDYNGNAHHDLVPTRVVGTCFIRAMVFVG